MNDKKQNTNKTRFLVIFIYGATTELESPFYVLFVFVGRQQN